MEIDGNGMNRSVFDAHCDTLTAFDTYRYSLYDAPCHFNLSKQLGYKGHIQVADIWVDRGRHDVDSRVDRYIDYFNSQLAANGDVGQILWREDIDACRRGLLLGIEGGECIDSDAADRDADGQWRFSRLRCLFGKGVRLITVTWNTPNEMSDTNCAAREPAGLTAFGAAAVKEMNRLGIAVDLSHISDRGFYDAAEISAAPVITSHSNSRALCAHSRNLTDDMFLTLTAKGGVTGINLCPGFLGEDPDVDTVIAHIEHFAALGGVSNVGIGSDFDGVEALPKGIEGTESLYKIFDRLLRMGYTEEQVDGIAGENFRRVFRAVLREADR